MHKNFEILKKNVCHVGQKNKLGFPLNYNFFKFFFLHVDSIASFWFLL